MKKRVRRGDPLREQQWQATVRQWQRSGQSVREFCRVQRLKESAFYFWRGELARRGRMVPAGGEGDERPPVKGARRSTRSSAPRRQTPRARQDQAGFLPVRVVLGHRQAAASGVEIVVGDSRVVRVQPGFDRQVLAEVLRVLEARPC